MTDDEVVKILTTDSFNDSPRCYYEAMNLAVKGFIQYSKIKKILEGWNSPDCIGDEQDKDYYFNRILDVFAGED